MRRRWRQDADTGKLVEILIHTGGPRVHAVGAFKEIISPITGERIANRAQLRDHERRTGQTNDLDSLRQQTTRELNKKPNTGTKHERKMAIRDSIERASSSGYNRKAQYED